MKNDFEHTLYVTCIDGLKHLNGKYNRIYFGNEFCERLIPSEKELGQVLDFTQDNHLNFTLLTPYVTNKGIERLYPLLKRLADTGNLYEVIFNDWGVLEIINREYNVLQPVMGRLLNKMKRGPRLMHFMNMIPEENVDYFRICSLEVPAYQKFLVAQRVKRAEIDNVLQGIDLNTSGSGINLSLNVPFAYVTTTRLCLSCRGEDPDQADRIVLTPCGHECRKYTFKLIHPVQGVPLLRKGNTMFIKNDLIPEGIGSQGFDRIVFEPEVPL